MVQALPVEGKRIHQALLLLAPAMWPQVLTLRQRTICGSSPVVDPLYERGACVPDSTQASLVGPHMPSNRLEGLPAGQMCDCAFAVDVRRLAQRKRVEDLYFNLILKLVDQTCWLN